MPAINKQLFANSPAVCVRDVTSLDEAYHFVGLGPPTATCSTSNVVALEGACIRLDDIQIRRSCGHPVTGRFPRRPQNLERVLVEMILGPATGRGKALDNGVVGFLYMPLGDEFLFAPMRLALSQANKMAAKP